MNMARIVVSKRTIPPHHHCAGCGLFGNSDRHGLGANKLCFQLRFTILEKHGDHLAQIGL